MVPVCDCLDIRMTRNAIRQFPLRLFLRLLLALDRLYRLPIADGRAIYRCLFILR